MALDVRMSRLEGLDNADDMMPPGLVAYYHSFIFGFSASKLEYFIFFSDSYLSPSVFPYSYIESSFLCSGFFGWNQNLQSDS